MNRIVLGSASDHGSRSAVGLLLSSLLTLLALTSVTAAGSESHAGIIIYIEDESTEYHLVEVAGADLSGMDLLERVGLELEVQPFGGFGEGVCSIDGHGCPSSNCFCESYSSPVYFWRYYIFDDGQWIPMHRGASQTTVEPGEIYAWVWSADNPEIPSVSFDELVQRATESKSEDATPTEGAIHDEPTAEPTAEAQPSATPDERSRATSDTMSDAGQSEESDDDGVASGEYLQFGVLLGFIGLIAGWVGIRRMRRDVSR